MCDTNKTLNRTKTGEQMHTTTTTRNAGEDAAAAAPVQAEQPAVVQAVRQQEITEVLPMRREAVPIPTIPQVLQRRAEPMQQPVPGGQSFKQRRRQKKKIKGLRSSTATMRIMFLPLLSSSWTDLPWRGKSSRRE